MSSNQFGDDLSTLQTDPASQPGNLELMHILFDKITDKGKEKEETVVKGKENFSEAKTFDWKSMLKDGKKAILLTLVFFILRTDMFRDLLAKVTTKPLLSEGISILCFVLLTFAMIRYV
jgi:hypothetical protein